MIRGLSRPSTRLGAEEGRKGDCEIKKALFLKPLQPSGARRRGVDGRDKPGHDGSGSEASPKRPNQQLAL